ncbi:MAG TPA: molybdate ABC transporter permease subunit [Blastocatellia bacterium]|nr:molybdate ABC transporter permease subunit [Blastocatellia bacterium]
MDWAAIFLSLRLAAFTTGILLVLGLPVAYWLATTKWRLKFLIEAVVALPIVLPPTVVGFYLLVVMGPNSPVGRTIESITGHRLPFTFGGILVGSILYNLPFAVRPFVSAFAGVDRRLVEASWCLGVSGIRTFFGIVCPLAWAGILTGLVLSFAHTIGEFGVVLMLGGDIPGVTRTVSISIFDDVQALNYPAANHTAIWLVVFAFVTLCITYALQRRVLPL